MVHREHCLEVADTIEKSAVPGLGFNMNLWFNTNAAGYRDMDATSPLDLHTCGTTACIAGWTYTKALNDKGVDWAKRYAAVSRGLNVPFIELEGTEPHHSETHNLWLFAQNYLGLTIDQAGGLFSDRTGSSITPAMAVAVLRHLAATGEVDWPKAIKCVRDAERETAKTELA